MGNETELTDQQRHEQMVADSQPLESPEAAQAAFEDLVAEAEGKEPPTRETPTQGAPQATAAPKETPAPTAAPASLFSPEELEALRQVPNAVKMLGGRVAAMQSDLTKMGNKAAAATAAAGSEAPSAAAIAAAAGDRAKWDKLVKDFPEWGEAIEQRIGAGGGITPEQLEEAKASARAEAIEEARKEAAALIEAQREADIAEAHEDWRGKLKSPGFKEWWGAQPEDYRKKLWNSNSARSIIGMLDKFDAAVIDSQAQQEQQSTSTAPPHRAAASTAPAIDLSAAVTKRGGTALPRASESDLSGKELWDHLTAAGTAR